MRDRRLVNRTARRQFVTDPEQVRVSQGKIELGHAQGRVAAGERDGNPVRHQVIDLSPVKPMVDEFRLHRIGCKWGPRHEIAASTRETFRRNTPSTRDSIEFLLRAGTRPRLPAIGGKERAHPQEPHALWRFVSQESVEPSQTTTPSKNSAASFSGGRRRWGTTASPQSPVCHPRLPQAEGTCLELPHYRHAGSV